MYYVYCHYLDKKPVYIGKGKNGRAYDKREYKGHKVVKLLENVSETKALEIEKWLINLIGLDNLKNKVAHNSISPQFKVDYDNFFDTFFKSTVEMQHKIAEKVFDDAVEGHKKAIELLKPRIKNLLKKFYKTTT